MIFLEIDHHGGWKIIVEGFLSENSFLTQNIKKNTLRIVINLPIASKKPKKLFQNPKSTRKQKSSQAQI
jgi:hypothetical protein